MLNVLGISPCHRSARHFRSLFLLLNAALNFQICMSRGSITSEVIVTVLQEVILRRCGYPCGQKSFLSSINIGCCAAASAMWWFLAMQLRSCLHTDEGVCPWLCEYECKKRRLNGLSANCSSCQFRPQYLVHRALWMSSKSNPKMVPNPTPALGSLQWKVIPVSWCGFPFKVSLCSYSQIS